MEIISGLPKALSFNKTEVRSQKDLGQFRLAWFMRQEERLDPSFSFMRQEARLDPSFSHLLLHTEVKPHECYRCLKVFSDSRNLRVHLLAHRQGTFDGSEKPWSFAGEKTLS